MRTILLASLLAMAGTSIYGDSVHKYHRTVLSQLYEFGLTTVIKLEKFAANGGAIAAMQDRLLVVTGGGRLATVAIQGNHEVSYLRGRVPMNKLALEDHAVAGDLDWSTYRVNDILLRQRGEDMLDLFVSHLYFTGSCFVMRVSATVIVRHSTGGGSSGYDVSPTWRTVYDTAPCLLPPFNLGQSGGSMLMDGPSHLLLTVGDFERVRGSPPEPQDPDCSLGKIMRIAIEDGEAEVFSLGHRNPQGLARDANGELWSTEHGPRGGDELNHIVPGNNYGWPYVTDGRWLPDQEALWQIEDQGTYALPAFAWVPGIGIGSLVVNDREALPLWEGDLLIASLTGEKFGEAWQDVLGHSIFRVRHQNQAIRYVERIILDVSIRDLAMLPNGRLALLHNNQHGVVFLEAMRERKSGH